MNKEANDRLLVAVMEAIGCDSSGSARDMISHGYLAIDNSFSALLAQAGAPTSRNHVKKAAAAFAILERQGVVQAADRPEIDEFYAAWQDARYSAKVFSPHDAGRFRRLMWRYVYRAIGFVARENGRTAGDVEDELYATVWGARWMKYHDHLSIVHEKWQEHAEEAAERGIGGRLGNKMMNPSNDSDLNVITDDEHVRKSLEHSDAIALQIGKLYDLFLALVATLRVERTAEQLPVDQITTFNLAVHIRYFGRPVSEVANEWAQFIMETVNEHSPSIDRSDREAKAPKDDAG